MGKHQNISEQTAVLEEVNPMSRTLLILVVVAIVFYLAFCALLFASQRSMIYYPQPPSPAIGASNFMLQTDGAQLQITAVPRNGPDAVVYFGGNAEDVNFSLPELTAAFPKHALYLMNYRSYGGSSEER